MAEQIYNRHVVVYCYRRNLGIPVLDVGNHIAFLVVLQPLSSGYLEGASKILERLVGLTTLLQEFCVANGLFL